MQNTIEVSIENCDDKLAEVIIALLSEQNYDNFWQDDTTLKAYCTETHFDTTVLENTLHPFNKTYSLNIIAPRNWNADWEANYDPVPINDEVAIVAPFHELQPVKHNVVIIPKMSFGTGHHATTYLMMNALSALDLVGAKVLDYGCGTGVLGIYAAIKGADKVLGIDIDEWCVENTLENIALNHVAQMQVQLGDIMNIDDKDFDVVLANINYNILFKNMDYIVQNLKQGGTLLLSGLLESDLESMKNLVESKGLKYIKYHNRLNWIYLHFSK